MPDESYYYDRILQGTPGDDIIIGYGGNDQLWGCGGADLLDGREGRDMAAYLHSPVAVTINLNVELQQVENNGEASGDRLISIENVTGSAFDDTLIGNAESNTLAGRGGADYIDGGEGVDRASYAMSDAGVVVDLMAEVQSGGHAEGDRLISIENISGSPYDDILLGDDKDNVFNGGWGADIIQGGMGVDIAEYVGSGAGVDVDLTREIQSGGYAEGDRLNGIEGVYGSAFADRIAGDAGTNILSGADGDDTIIGGGGFDFINGGAGNDRIEVTGLSSVRGGEGADTLVVDVTDYRAGEWGGYGFYVSVWSDGRIALSTNTSYPYGENMRIAEGVEVLEFKGSEHGDVAYGGAADDIIHGGGGDDELRGYGGNDIIDGGDGNDVIWADVLDNHLSGPGGADILRGGAGNDVIHANIDVASIDGGDGYDVAVISSTPEQGAVTLDVRSFGEVGSRVTNIESFQLFGSHGDDTLTGGRSADVLRGNGGNDTLRGGYNDDKLYGGAGDDLLDGEDGDDWLEGGAGRDTYIGGAGDDTLHVHDLGFASLDGGEGFDTLMIAPQGQNSHYVIDGQAGTISNGATFTGIESIHLYETVPGGFARASYDIIGTDNADTLAFSDASGRVRFEAGGGDDQLSGGSANDILDGGDGDDRLRGSGGDDTLTGGDGADTFVFRSIWSQGQDIVTDFDATEGDAVLFQWNLFSVINDYEDFASAATQTEDGVLLELYEPGVLATVLFQGAELSDFNEGNVTFA